MLEEGLFVRNKGKNVIIFNYFYTTSSFTTLFTTTTTEAGTLISNDTTA
jgi:hypothetical protein